ncbi:MAG: ABA4-like family protein [Hyphomicrobiaceae bacterium]
MTWETAFSIANLMAGLCWMVLIVLPRGWPVLPAIIRLAVPLLLAIAYSALVLAFFFTVDGGFDSIAHVRTLFQSDPVLLAGWLHYLAFDLLIGAWIADKADQDRISRLIQAPILFATFMFGPLGWLLFQAVSLGQHLLVAPAAQGVRS